MEDDNNRKATDVLLSIESKLESLLNHHKSQDLNLKILSNKINSFIDSLPSLLESSKSNKAPQQKITVEAVDTSRNIEVKSELPLYIENNPTGNRRVSRDHQEDKSDFKDYDLQKNSNSFPEISNKKENPQETNFVVQVTQRVTDKNQKSVFLAEVEVKDLSGNVIHKTRTNSVGKWSGTIKPGNYRIFINKKESSMKQKIEVSQDVNLDSSKSMVILPDLIIK